MRVTIKFGSGNELVKEFPEGTSLGCAIKNPHVRGALGYGENVEGHIGGVPQDDSLTLRDGMTVSVNSRACAKA